MQTRFAFVIAAWNRFVDWREGRAKAREQRELEKRRTSKPVVTTQVVPARRGSLVAAPAAVEFQKTGVERVAQETASRRKLTTGIAAFKTVAAPRNPSKPS